MMHTPGPLQRLKRFFSSPDDEYRRTRWRRRQKINALVDGDRKKVEIRFTSRIQFYAPNRDHRTLLEGFYSLPWPVMPRYKVKVTLSRQYSACIVTSIKIKGLTPWGIAPSWKGKKDLSFTKLCGARKHLGKTGKDADDLEALVDEIYETTRITPHTAQLWLNNLHWGPLLAILTPLFWILLIWPQAFYQYCQKVKKRRQRKKETWEV